MNEQQWGRWVAKGLELDYPYDDKMDRRDYIEMITFRLTCPNPLRGSVISQNQCDDCDTWTVGEKHCTCGETRLWLNVKSLDDNGNPIFFADRA